MFYRYNILTISPSSYLTSFIASLYPNILNDKSLVHCFSLNNKEVQFVLIFTLESPEVKWWTASYVRNAFS